MIPEDQAQTSGDRPPVWNSCYGAVDRASSSVVSGWAPSKWKTRDFAVEIDGERIRVFPRFFSRADLLALNIDGLGFEAHFHSPKSSFHLRMLVCDGPHEAVMAFSQTGSTTFEVSEFAPEVVVIPAGELPGLLQALEVDTVGYKRFVGMHARALTAHGVKIDCLFVDGTYGSVSVRYRNTNVADGLRRLGYSVACVRTDEIEAGALGRINCRTAVFLRAPFDATYRAAVDELRRNGTRIVYDIDDLVFDEDVVALTDGARFLTADEMERYFEGVAQYRAFISSADAVTTTTEFLARAVAGITEKPVSRIVNSIGKLFEEFYADDKVEYIRAGAPFSVGYYSGSKTHQADFCAAAPALVRFLRTFPETRLRLVGMFELSEFPDFGPLRDRIDLLPMLPYHKMIEDLANCDVIIAPLVIGDPFCESKSELKFFEAALRGRVCIAAATEAFRLAMKDGEVGCLASTEEEWFAHLQRLYLSPSERERMARAARRHAIEAYSYRVAGQQARDALFGCESAERRFPARLAAPPARQPAESPLEPHDIAILVPGVSGGSGGLRKIFRFCSDWARAGKQITVYVPTADHPSKISTDIKRWFYDFPCSIRNFRGRVGRHDAYVCTHWSTAYALRDFEAKEEIWYFVQDFEPMFDSVSTNYVKALSTYSMGFNLVCFGSWVADRLKREIGAAATVIPFTLDREIYSSSPVIGKSIDILFFARPSQPRRCFELGVDALRRVFKRNSTLRIALFGEKDYGDLGFAYRNLGMVEDLHRLADIYRKSQLGVCFSSTNPSLVGYEMLACGAPILDLRLPGSHLNFQGERFVHYADPNPRDLADAIGRALAEDPLSYESRVKDGLDFVATLGSDEDIGRRFMAAMQTRESR